MDARRTTGSNCVREQGFTLVEVLVVMLIVAVMIGIGVRSLGGTKTQATATKSRVVALQLSEAASQFQRDHGGRVPGNLSGAGLGDWDARRISPIDRANGSKPYLKTAGVEALIDGTVSLEARGGTVVSPGRASTQGRVRYDADTARNVFIVVAYARRGGRLQPTCYVSPFNASAVAALRNGNGGVTRTC